MLHLMIWIENGNKTEKVILQIFLLIMKHKIQNTNLYYNRADWML